MGRSRVALMLLAVIGLTATVSTNADGAARHVATVAAGQIGGGWPMFDHDPLHSGVTTDSVLSSLSAPNLKLDWSAPISVNPGAILASPAVAFSAALGETLVYDVTSRGGVEAFNETTGAMVWQATVPYQISGKGLAYGDVSSPAVFDDTVYLGTTGALVALNADTGATECTFNLPVAPPETAPGVIDASPVVGDFSPNGPIVYFGDKGQSEALNGGHEWAITGVGNTAGGCQVIWSFDDWKVSHPPGKLVGSWSSPALVQDSAGQWLVIFGSSDPDDAVYALDASSGEQVWRFQTPPDGDDHDVGAPPMISPPGANGNADGVVYIQGKDYQEFALDLSTGRQIWSFPFATVIGKTVDSVAGAALLGNTLYVPYFHWVFAFNASTGQLVGYRDLKAGTFYSSTVIVSPAAGVAGDPILVLGSTRGYVALLDPFDGDLVAKVTPILAGADGIYSTAAVADGLIFEATVGGELYALST